MKAVRLILILICLALVLLGTGCDRYVPFDSPQEDPPEELPIPDITAINPGAGSLRMTWEVDSDINVSYYRIYHAINAGGEFLAQDSTNGLGITVTGLDMGETHRFAVAPVSRRGIEGYWSRIVTLVPAEAAAIKRQVID